MARVQTTKLSSENKPKVNKVDKSGFKPDSKAMKLAHSNLEDIGSYPGSKSSNKPGKKPTTTIKVTTKNASGKTLKNNVDSRNIKASTTTKKGKTGTDLTKPSENNKILTSGTTAGLHKKGLPYSRLQTAKLIKKNAVKKEEEVKKKEGERQTRFVNTKKGTFEATDKWVEKQKGSNPVGLVKIGDKYVAKGRGQGTKKAIAKNMGVNKSKVETLEDIAKWNNTHTRKKSEGPAGFDTVASHGRPMDKRTIKEEASKNKEERAKENRWQSYSHEQTRLEDQYRTNSKKSKKPLTEEQIRDLAFKNNKKKEGVFTKGKVTPVEKPKQTTATANPKLPIEVKGFNAVAETTKRQKESEKASAEWRKAHPHKEETTTTTKPTTTKTKKETKKTEYTDEELLKAMGFKK